MAILDCLCIATRHNAGHIYKLLYLVERNVLNRVTISCRSALMLIDTDAETNASRDAAEAAAPIIVAAVEAVTSSCTPNRAQAPRDAVHHLREQSESLRATQPLRRRAALRRPARTRAEPQVSSTRRKLPVGDTIGGTGGCNCSGVSASSIRCRRQEHKRRMHDAELIESASHGLGRSRRCCVLDGRSIMT